MNITEVAIKKNRITLVGLLIIILGGLTSYSAMPRSEDPGFTIRTAVVTTIFPGASPKRVEMLLTDKIEKVIQEMPQINFITSESKTGISIVFVNIQESYKEMRPIWDNLRRKVENITQELPDGIVGPFVDDEFGDVFGVILTITGEGFTYAELKKVADEVRDELLLIKQVAKVEIYGHQEERIFVEYSNVRLSEMGISPFQLKSILESRNIIIPGGEVTTGGKRLSIEPSGNFESIEDLRKTVVAIPGRTDVVYLGDITKVYRGYIDPPKSKMHASGVPCIGLALSLREGGNIIVLGKRTKSVVKRLQEQYPIGIEFDFVSFQPGVVKKSVDDFVSNLLQAIGIVIFVMVVFLGLRTGILVATLIPMTMLLSMMLMSVFDIGLNRVSLAALIIALGMLVDNAIVMSESIMVQIKTGKTHLKAAVDSANELRIPLITSSLTTAAAFLPIFLAKSSLGEYTGALFKVVTIALLSSWALSLTMIPMLCYMFLKVKQSGDGGFDGRFYRIYRWMLVLFLRNRFLTIIGVVLIFFGTMMLFSQVTKLFMPPSDRPDFTAEFTLPIGTTIKQTEHVVSEVEAYLAKYVVSKAKPGEKQQEGIINWSTNIGNGGARFYLAFDPEPPSPNYAMMHINATSDKIVPVIIDGIKNFCGENFFDVEAKVDLLQNGPPVKAPIQVRVFGSGVNGLFDIVETIQEHIINIEGTRNIRNDWGMKTPKLVVNINQERAKRAGVTNQDIATSLQTMFSGFTTTEYRENDKVIPINMRSVAADRQDIGKIESLNVYMQSTGRSIPLKQVADVEVVWQTSKIKRRDRVKTVTISVDLDSGYTATKINKLLIPWLNEQKSNWAGYDYDLGGEAESSEEASASIAEQLPIAGFIILILLVTQFNSLRRPAIILMTIPLGLIGVIIGLFITNSYFGFMTLLGVVALAGIVINNAIVLLDRIGTEIEENGLPAQNAIVESGQRRMRPILLTTATTVLGLLPLWFGGGPMWEPMAITIIFGLLFSTVLTLGVVPVLYSILFRVNFKGFRYE